MSELGLKQKAVAATLGVVALYALAVGFWFLHAESAWKSASRKYETAKNQYAKECREIARKAELQQEHEDAKALMPIFEDGKATDTTWQRKIGAIAEKNRIVITQQQAGKETVEEGDVKELSIEVRKWEGCLEALVRFMHELENTNEGRFDFRELNFSPISSKKGYLSGSFTLTCAYMRGEK